MKLIVGLGNPGREYKDTRHNLGFRVVDLLAESHGSDVWRSQFEGMTAEIRLGGEKVVLLKPMTYMNRSGRSVRAAAEFYKLENVDILVICDDLNLSVGRQRIRGQGRAGGQNGLNDVIRHLGTDEISRLRIGIGRPEFGDPVDFVLSGFSAAERGLVHDCVIEAARAAEHWARNGLESAMNEFNGRDLSKE